MAPVRRGLKLILVALHWNRLLGKKERPYVKGIETTAQHERSAAFPK